MTAAALPLNLTVDSLGNLLNGSGVASETQYGYNDNNPTDNLDFLNSEIWNSDGASKLPTLTTATSTGDLDLGDSSDFTTSGST